MVRADWASGTIRWVMLVPIESITPLLSPGKTPNIGGFGTPWHARPCVLAPSSPVLKLLGFTGFPIVPFIAPVQLLALTTPTYRLWLGTCKKKGLPLAPSVGAELLNRDLTQGEERQGKAGEGRGKAGGRQGKQGTCWGHRSKSQPLLWQTPPCLPPSPEAQPTRGEG